MTNRERELERLAALLRENGITDEQRRCEERTGWQHAHAEQMRRNLGWKIKKSVAKNVDSQ